jgi:hypothetical protein
MSRDRLDQAATGIVLDKFASKSPGGQKLWCGYILDEFGKPIVTSKKEAIRILDDPSSDFSRRVAATIFAEAYKRVVDLTNRQ